MDIVLAFSWITRGPGDGAGKTVGTKPSSLEDLEEKPQGCRVEVSHNSSGACETISPGREPWRPPTVRGTASSSPLMLIAG
jgi:hypothetical protein